MNDYILSCCSAVDIGEEKLKYYVHGGRIPAEVGLVCWGKKRGEGET